MPTPGLGLQSFVGFVTEGTYGTDPGSGYKYHRIVSESILPAGELTRGNRGLGRLGVSSVRNRIKRNEGDIVFDAQYDGLEVMLLHYYGGTDNYSADTPVAFAYTHEYSPSTTRKVGLTMHINQGNTKAVVTGCKINRMEYNITNENLEISFGVIGKVHSETTLDTAVYPTGPDVLALDGTGGTSGLIAQIDATPLNIRSARFTADFPYETGREYLGYDIMQEPVPNDIIRASGELVREFEDTTFSTKWINNTQAALTFEYLSGTYLTGTTRRSHKLTISQVVFGSARGPVESGGVLVERIPFTAIVSGSNFFKTTLINGAVGATT